MNQTGDASAGSILFQAGRDIVVKGDVVARVPMMELVPAAPGMGRVPMVPWAFVGRGAELARLDAAVAGSGGRAVVVAVHGLGGVGKSTLAARFAEQRAQLLTLAWWITADSSAALETGLAELAVALAPQTTSLSLEQRIELAVRWLASHDEWLLVLDNLTDPADAAGLLERVRTGTVVITSRRTGGWSGATTVTVDVLSPAEAVQLLTRIAREQWPQADLTGAERLCAALGWLPLAIEQAGAFLAQARIPPSSYLELLDRFPARMFTETVASDNQRTVARIWHVTLDRLADTPLAGDLLRRLAWFAPDGIPRHFLTGGDVPDLDVVTALSRLASYSMITLTADTIGVHRLVQAVSRTADTDDPYRQPDDIAHAHHLTTITLAEALTSADPKRPADWPVFQTVMPHAQALLTHTDPGSDTSQLCELASLLGRYLDDHGDTTTAIVLFTRAARSRERLHGSDHPDTLTSRNDLADAYESAGNLERAIPLYEETLADRQRVLGPDHPDTLISRNGLANAYESAGNLERAIPLYERTLADRQRVLGPDDPRTLISQHNLAFAYQAAGDLERAVLLFEATLAHRKQVLGADHPDTVNSQHNLAYVYRVTGDLERAVPLYEAALANAERILGFDHPNTLTVRHNLACAYEWTGDLKSAIPLFEATLASRQRVHGTDHPSTLSVRDNLASAYLSIGDTERGISLRQSTIADAERVLGSDHPLTKRILPKSETMTDKQ
ncbi:FxSxx-COOH system tetratricopeptide repeat protein [Saccharothrix saharensis]|uniref:FxSxx-COOH system tetratricopeptide repeat protein n=1 Tax=Saccharothrix saharensis TaxID=571190 RepID=UPI0036783277